MLYFQGESSYTQAVKLQMMRRCTPSEYKLTKLACYPDQKVWHPFPQKIAETFDSATRHAVSTFDIFFLQFPDNFDPANKKMGKFSWEWMVNLTI